MTSRAPSSVIEASLNTGMDCGPVRRASQICVGVESYSGGATLPSVSAPPAPTALWHIEQLVRNSSIPFAGSPGSTCAAEGMAGPGPRLATYADSAAVCSSVMSGSLRSACGELLAIGIRPVETWKCTEAAPTPTSEGARSVPWASRPWQVEQLVRNKSWPVAIWSSSATCAWAGSEEVTAAYATPVRMRARSSTTTGASRCRLLAASTFTVLVSLSSGRAGRVGRWSDEDLEEVDDEEHRQPHDVDEVPVVGHDDGAGRLEVPEPVGGVGPAEDVQEGDEPADHVQRVEAGHDVEDRAVRAGGDRHPVADEFGVLEDLAGDEEGAHEVGEDEPLLHAPPAQIPQRTGAARLEAFGGEHAELGGHRARHEDQGDRQRPRDVEHRVVLRPDITGDGAVGEVHGKQPGEEHQLAGQPDDRSHRHRVGSVDAHVGGAWSSRCRRHVGHYGPKVGRGG